MRAVCRALSIVAEQILRFQIVEVFHFLALQSLVNCAKCRVIGVVALPPGWDQESIGVVTIFNEQGITLEQGSATLVHEGYWKYETEVPGSVLVEAFDLAGNVTRWTGALPGTPQGLGYAAQSPSDAA